MPCPYLPGRLERKVLTELTGTQAEPLHNQLSRAGFRRSHGIAYAPACPTCRACVPVRVVVDAFARRRTLARTFKRNADLTVRRLPARAQAEHYRLFTEYQRRRHAGSDMALMGYYEYRSMIEDSPIETCLYEFRDPAERLIAVCLADHMDDGLSAVYSFYDPEQTERSLGTHTVLWLIEHARALGLPYVYLGFWIAQSPKMSYKERFQPLEAYRPAVGWGRLDATAERSSLNEADHLTRSSRQNLEDASAGMVKPFMGQGIC